MRLRTVMGAITLTAATAVPLALPSTANAVEDIDGSGLCRGETITLPGATAEYSECRVDDGIEVKGVIKDTAWDGECAYLSIHFNNGESPSDWDVCGSGKSFEFYDVGWLSTDAKVYLSEY